MQNSPRLNKKKRYLSTSGLVLIWGDAALEGEKLWLYKPDIALFFLRKESNEMGFPVYSGTRQKKKKKGVDRSV